ncbi:LysR family transcriptional regulator [Virgibacillus halodenitrificans]|uniref:LysR family transcriptional regulator n=1 Tax=Virgibacillus halodenitrificans TaxID=1482 RepID=UPI00076116D3|nr:LysR family transcriptional regulator [Virgibacillus halodenitrificans]MCG1027131.1 LysR family transcriptional regulator [Virgibacillus halodenitrificans]
MNLHKLYCFTKVVEEGSISKAAKVLNMTQPPLSIAIQSFEEELNAKLFERKGRRLILTDIGELLYERAKEVFALTNQISNEVKDQKSGQIGTVNVGCSTVANLTVLPEVIKNIREETADIVVKVKEGNSHYVISELRNNNIDVGIVRNVFQAEDLDFNTIITEPLMLALPPEHHLLGKTNITLEDLKHENFLLQSTTLGRNISDIIIESCYKNGYTPKVIYWGTSTLPMLSMVRKGLGIAFVPKIFEKLDEVALPPMVEFIHPDFTTNLTIVTPKDRYISSAAKKFLLTTKKVIETLYEH